MTDLKGREKQLQERLAELGGRVQRIEAHLEQTPDPDWAERATEAEMDEVLEGIGHADTTEMQAIHAALKRIKDGTYGVCVRCEKEISQERLDALPHTPLCRTCAREVGKKA